MADSKNVELDIWINKKVLNRFMNEFDNLNDVKFECDDINTEKDGDVRVSLLYRNFGGELNYPEQTYYQLNNVFEGE